ncbi:MAG: hypothetical protein BGP16_01235 [Sphingobium sp. 66-54]|nr:MAG: hypothetical protein BGP16_01235 [Sphingobium sp. 66-54]
MALAACTDYGGEPVRPGPGPARWTTLTGTVTYRERIALPSNARLQVEIRDVSRADARAPLIASTTSQTRGRQVPLPFTLRYNTDRLERGHRYAVSARITEGNRLIWTTDTHYELRPGQGSMTLNLVSVRSDQPGRPDRPDRPRPPRRR